MATSPVSSCESATAAWATGRRRRPSTSWLRPANRIPPRFSTTGRFFSLCRSRPLRDMVCRTHTIKVSREDWIAVENTREGIVALEKFDQVQTGYAKVCGAWRIEKRNWPLRGKVRCSVCGHAMSCKPGKQMYFYCYILRYNDSFTCIKSVQGADRLCLGHTPRRPVHTIGTASGYDSGHRLPYFVFFGG